MIPQFPLLPVPAVLQQNKMDEVISRTYYPSTYTREYYPEYRIVQTGSYRAWAVPCPYYLCTAKIGERCNGAGGIHAARRTAYRAKFGPAKPLTRENQPRWYRELLVRMSQRWLISALERSAYNQSMANNYLDELRTEAREMNVDPAMISRAVAYGHKRAEREIRKRAGRRAEERAARRERLELDASA